MKITSIISNGIHLTKSKKIDKYIEIVGSTNPRLNAMANESRLSIAAVLRQHYAQVGITVVNDMDDLEALVAKKPDLVVLGMKVVLLEPAKGYDNSPKVWLASYLEENGIAYTGSDGMALAVEYEKPDAKQKVIDAGLKSSAFFVSSVDSPTFSHKLRYPLFVKPTNRGDSKGIDEQSVVYSDTDLKKQILLIHNEFSSDALIEEYLPGREFSVGVIRKQDSDELLAMPIEIIAATDERGHSYLSAKVKKADTERVVSIDDQKLRGSLNTLAVGVFKTLGARDYGRIDMRLDTDNIPNFIEANLMPGLSTHGYLSRCFNMNQNISYHDMMLAIVELGLSRSRTIYQMDLDEELSEVLATEPAIVLPPLV